MPWTYSPRANRAADSPLDGRRRAENFVDLAQTLRPRKERKTSIPLSRNMCHRGRMSSRPGTPQSSSEPRSRTSEISSHEAPSRVIDGAGVGWSIADRLSPERAAALSAAVHSSPPTEFEIYNRVADELQRETMEEAAWNQMKLREFDRRFGGHRA